MRLSLILLALSGVLLLSACDPSGVDPAQKAYHKANRDAYLYQGL